jgi:hypothetical protein
MTKGAINLRYSPCSGSTTISQQVITAIEQALARAFTRPVTVKEVLPTIEEAQAEVRRLNALPNEGGAGYIWQHHPYLPQGRSAADDESSSRRVG